MPRRLLLTQDAREETRRFHAYRASLRARRLNPHPPGAGRASP